MNIFVAKLSSAITSEDLQELFEDYGTVESAKVITDKFTGHSKRFGFVEMKNNEEALKAIEELDECEYDDSTIVVKKSKPKSDNRENGAYNRRNEYNQNNEINGNRRFSGNQRN